MGRLSDGINLMIDNKLDIVDAPRNPHISKVDEWLHRVADYKNMILIAGNGFDGFKIMLWDGPRWIGLAELLDLYHQAAALRRLKESS